MKLRWGLRDNILIYLLLIILAFTFIRLIQLLIFGMNIFPDSGDYLVYAQHILKGDFISPGGKRTPGYPFMIASAWILFGKNPTAIGIFQIILNAVAQFLLGYMLVKAQYPKAALFTLVIFNLSPLSYFSLNILAGSFTIFLLISFIYFVYTYYNNRKRFTLFEIIFTSALLGLTRPQYFFVIFVAGIWLLMVKERRLAIIILTTVVLAAGVWSYINYKYYDYFGVSTLTGFNLIDHTGSLIASAHSVNPELVDKFVKKRELLNKPEENFLIWDIKNSLEESLNYDDIKLSKELTKISLYIILNHPLKYMESCLNAGMNALKYKNGYEYKSFSEKLLRLPDLVGLILFISGIIILIFYKIDNILIGPLLKVMFFSNLFISSVIDIGENFRYMIPLIYVPIIFLGVWFFNKLKHNIHSVPN